MPAPPARIPALATWRPAAGQVYDCPDGFQLQNVLEPKLTQKFVIILFSFLLEKQGYSMIDIFCPKTFKKFSKILLPMYSMY